MSTNILVLAAEYTAAGDLVATIAETDPSITTADDVIAGCVAVGLNRLLSHYTFPTAAALISALALSHAASATTVVATLSSDDTTRVGAVNLRIVGGGGSEMDTTDIICAAARTGLAMLRGIDTTLPPLRSP